MATDKFKKLAPVFEVHRDGEQVRVKKLGTIVDSVQEGMRAMEEAIGDVHNRQALLDTNPLFQNSLGRSIGPVDELSITPIKTFEIIQSLKSSLHQGLIRWPFSSKVAESAGSQSLNLLPYIDQSDKIGLGCSRDDGQKCLAGYTTIYQKEKTILANSLFENDLQYWTATSGATIISGVPSLYQGDVINRISYSEDPDEWTFVGDIDYEERATIDPNGSSNATLIKQTSTSDNAYIEFPFVSGANNESDWTFSFYAKALSGTVPLWVSLESATATVTVDGDEYGTAIESSGIKYWYVEADTEWKRYYIHGSYDVANNDIAPKLYTAIPNYFNDATNIYIWGAQLDEELSAPSPYLYTDGAVSSGTLTGAELAQSISTIPGHIYQLYTDINLPANATLSYYHDSQLIKSFTTSGRLDRFATFTADSDASNIRVKVVGTGTQDIPVYEIRLDPGTPCHAMNCPGFSAYKKNREYRAVLPPITISGHQYYGNILKIPERFSLSLSEELPGNIMGVFDHELNRMVPDTLLSWEFANWPIGGLARAGLVEDVEFEDSWTTAGANTFPSEFEPVGSGVGATSQGTVTTSAKALSTPDDISDLKMWISAEHFDNPDLGLSNGDNVFGQGYANPVWSGVVPTSKDGYDGGAISLQYRPTTLGGRTTLEFNSQSSRSGGLTWPSIDLSNGGMIFIAGYTNSLGQFAPFGDSSSDYLGAYWDSAATSNFKYTLGAFSEFQISQTYTWPVNSGMIWVFGFERVGSSVKFYHWHNNNDYSNGATTSASNVNSIHRTGFTSLTAAVDRTNFRTRIGEYLIYDKFLTSGEREAVASYLGSKYDVEQSGLTLTSGISSTGTVTTESPTDILQITVDSGSSYGITKTFEIDDGNVYTWEYTIRGDLGYSGVLETYEVLQGGAEADIEIDSEYEAIPVSGLEFTYQVSGLTLPGESAWATIDDDWWLIKHKVRATQPDTLLKLSIYLESQVDGEFIQLGYMDLKPFSSSSSKFSYCGDPVLGLNWEGDAQHITEENLLELSDTPYIGGKWSWPNTFIANQPSPTGTDGTLFQASGGQQFLTYTFSSGTSLLKDSTYTMQFSAKSDSPNDATTSAVFKVLQAGTLVYSGNFDLSSQYQDYAFVFSGVTLPADDGLQLQIGTPAPGNQMVLAKLQLHHGSGLEDYVQTFSQPVEKYRKQLLIQNVSSLTEDWKTGYARIITSPITDAVYTVGEDGSYVIASGFSDFVNFPASGVIRAGNAELAYKSKQQDNTSFVQAAPRWRGTDWVPSEITSGSAIYHIPLPLPIYDISGTLLTMEDTFPAPDGDWANSVRLQLYNTNINNLDRFSMTASAVPLSQAVGSLVAAFVDHASDRERHFSTDMLCASLVDPASWCSTPDMRITASVADATIEEINEEINLTVNTIRFMSPTTKNITVNWGDGSSTVYTRTGTQFGPLTHTYNLGTNRFSTIYTIRVRVEDTELGVSRTTALPITVTPVDKALQISRAQIIVPISGVQSSRALVQAEFSGVQSSRAYLTSG